MDETLQKFLEDKPRGFAKVWADKCGLSVATLSKVLRGAPLTVESALIAADATDGELTFLDLVDPDIRDALLEQLERYLGE